MGRAVKTEPTHLHWRGPRGPEAGAATEEGAEGTSAWRPTSLRGRNCRTGDIRGSPKKSTVLRDVLEVIFTTALERVYGVLTETP